MSVKRSAAAPAALPPAWRRAEAAGRAARGSVLLRHANPYAYGSQCWVIFERARCKTLNA